MTPVEIANHATAAITRLETEVLDALQGSDEFRWLFDKLDDWGCTVRVDTFEWAPLSVVWTQYVDDDYVAFVLHVDSEAWAHIERVDATEIKKWVPRSPEPYRSNIRAAADVALAEFEKLKERANV